jgi:light-regulated signal transduction histidine kinase (bacteriophytochrome)
MGEESEVLRLHAELEALKKELDAFSYAVAHDLRAPLRIIDGFSEALVDDYRDKLDAQGVDYLNRVREAAQAMEQLINGLLELSRVTRAPIRPETIDVTDVAKSIATGLGRGRTIQWNIQHGLTIEGDLALMRIAIGHLLQNAVKFTRKREVANIAVGSDQGVLFVRDDGVGFDPAYAPKLFTPFQRMHSANDFEGVGMGLAIVRRIVARHGGKVWAEGTVDGGAAFYVRM